MAGPDASSQRRSRFRASRRAVASAPRDSSRIPLRNRPIRGRGHGPVGPKARHCHRAARSEPANGRSRSGSSLAHGRGIRTLEGIIARPRGAPSHGHDARLWSAHSRSPPDHSPTEIMRLSGTIGLRRLAEMTNQYDRNRSRSGWRARTRRARPRASSPTGSGAGRSCGSGRPRWFPGSWRSCSPGSAR